MKTEKKCFKCGEVKILSAFYKHPQMADGHVNKCKECNKLDVRENRSKNIYHYREYDIRRGNRQSKEYRDEYNLRKPLANRARRILGYHVRAGNISKKPCVVCGANGRVHAHHDDYSKPLDVTWFCVPCHHAWHKDNGEAKNVI